VNKINKTNTIRKIQTILNKQTLIPRILNKEEFEFIYLILKKHPHFKQKEKVGIENIFIKKTIFNNNGFFIKRTDGTITDFSFYKCLNGENNLQKIKSLFRAGIKEQIWAFRDKAFLKEDSIICPILGVPVEKYNCHIDHFEPMFDELFNQFITQNNLDLKKIKLGGENQDNTMQYYFLDKKLEEKWQKFHFENAKLRVTSIRGNLTRKRGE